MRRTRGLELVALMVVLAGATAQAQCKNDGDCRAGRICQDGACVARQCSKDTDCPHDGICEAALCRSATDAPRATSSSSSEAVTPALAPRASEGPEVKTENLRGLWIAGIATFAGAYLTTVIVTAAVTDGSDRAAAVGLVGVPVFGPLAYLANYDVGPYFAPLVLSSLAQGAGVAMFITGLVVRRPVTTVSLGTSPDAPKLAFMPVLSGAPGAQVSLRY